jgi:hypothetical protein
VITSEVWLPNRSSEPDDSFRQCAEQKQAANTADGHADERALRGLALAEMSSNAEAKHAAGCGPDSRTAGAINSQWVAHYLRRRGRPYSR